MRNIRITIEYDGTGYSGWQSQKNSTAVQDVVEKAIHAVTGERVRVTGASRTDSGVHARGQSANFKTSSRLPITKIKCAINRHLPRDVSIVGAVEVSEDFHSQYNAKAKLYRYTIYTGAPAPVFDAPFVTQTQYKLDIGLMKSEAKALIGKRDFSSFQGTRSMRSSPVRDLRTLDIKKKGRYVTFDLEADGFLYNMARSIVGTLIDLGRGRLKEGSAKKMLKARDRRSGGITAPAKGLCLIKVKY